MDPIGDASRAILDGHIVLSRALATAGHFPQHRRARIDLPAHARDHDARTAAGRDRDAPAARRVPRREGPHRDRRVRRGHQPARRPGGCTPRSNGWLPPTRPCTTLAPHRTRGPRSIVSSEEVAVETLPLPARTGAPRPPRCKRTSRARRAACTANRDARAAADASNARIEDYAGRGACPTARRRYDDFNRMQFRARQRRRRDHRRPRRVHRDALERRRRPPRRVDGRAPAGRRARTARRPPARRARDRSAARRRPTGRRPRRRPPRPRSSRMTAIAVAIDRTPPAPSHRRRRGAPRTNDAAPPGFDAPARRRALGPATPADRPRAPAVARLRRTTTGATRRHAPTPTDRDDDRTADRRRPRRHRRTRPTRRRPTGDGPTDQARRLERPGRPRGGPRRARADTADAGRAAIPRRRPRRVTTGDRRLPRPRPQPRSTPTPLLALAADAGGNRRRSTAPAPPPPITDPITPTVRPDARCRPRTCRPRRLRTPHPTDANATRADRDDRRAAVRDSAGRAAPPDRPRARRPRPRRRHERRRRRSPAAPARERAGRRERQRRRRCDRDRRASRRRRRPSSSSRCSRRCARRRTARTRCGSS